jgi:uncharacterized membrane protein YkoI
MSQEEAAQLALRDSPGEVTTTTKTMRGAETFYSFDIRGAQGTRRVLVDATHGKVMATIPVGE